MAAGPRFSALGAAVADLQAAAADRLLDADRFLDSSVTPQIEFSRGYQHDHENENGVAKDLGGAQGFRQSAGLEAR
jgi:hypothetical protein